MRKALLPLLAISLLAVLPTARAADGPINSSLPFISAYIGVTPTPYKTLRKGKDGSSILTFKTCRGALVLRQHWFPPSVDGSQKVQNEIFNGSGRVGIFEEVSYSPTFQTANIRSYDKAHGLIAVRFSDGGGNAFKITDASGQSITETQYSALLKCALREP